LEANIRGKKGNKIVRPKPKKKRLTSRRKKKKRGDLRGGGDPMITGLRDSPPKSPL